MGCFGLSSSKKRRNSTRKILPRHQVSFFNQNEHSFFLSILRTNQNTFLLQRICSYELLHSSDPVDASTVSDNPEKISCSNLRSVFLPFYSVLWIWIYSKKMITGYESQTKTGLAVHELVDCNMWGTVSGVKWRQRRRERRRRERELDLT